MTGAQLVAFVKQRLGIAGLTLDERYSTAAIEDALTEARDEVIERLTLAAPIGVQSSVALDLDVADDRHYTIPTATTGPYRVLAVMETDTGEVLTPSTALNQDGGHYAWTTPRDLYLADDVSPSGGLTVTLVATGAAITSASTEAQVGAPVTAHRALGHKAAVLCLMIDEQSDARGETLLYEQAMDRLERLYEQYDEQGASAMRTALLSNYGDLMGDMLP